MNTIKKLRKEDGEVVEGEEDLKALVTNYFFSLFTSVAGLRCREKTLNPRVVSLRRLEGSQP